MAALFEFFIALFHREEVVPGPHAATEELELGPGPQADTSAPIPADTTTVVPAPLLAAEPTIVFLISLEELPICNIDEEVLAGLSSEDRDRIRRFRLKIRTKAIYGPDLFPGDIRIADVALALDQGYWESAAGGIVTLLPSGDWDAYSFSPNMNLTEGSEDAEVWALIRGLNKNLREANNRFKNGVCVHKIVCYLDPKFWLLTLKGLHYRPGYSKSTIAQLFRVSHLITNAGIELQPNWLPKRAKIRPHVIADQMAVEHQTIAHAKEGRNQRQYRDLKFIPPIASRNFRYYGPRPAKRSYSDMDRD
ncbi:hypothetical protein E6O75_ATG09608 [Venturia nashicola]|uniref:Uncharacterized protein n=1 Tax=Venturia nashicola TaxID=86259 RepID=A0A4Z1NZ30_9PEZI|nr:hypothetical protein E6O75_ATG09608 [Venturia nashicola]